LLHVVSGGEASARPSPSPDDASRSASEPALLLPPRLIVTCRRGNDSRIATAFLRDSHVDQTVNLTGGLTAWKQLVDPHFNMY